MEAAYVQFGDLYPDQQLQLQLLYGASQRAFERRTRVSARGTVVRVLGNALSDPRLGDAKANEHLTEYLDQEIADLRGRLAQDSATAVGRGLNIGLAMGSVAGLSLLVGPLLWGVDLLGVLGVTLNRTNRWNLMGAFVCGGIVTAFEPPATVAEICLAPGTPGSAAAGTEFWGFWCAIGLVAGFNERWAFGILSRDSTRRSSKNS